MTVGRLGPVLVAGALLAAACSTSDGSDAAVTTLSAATGATAVTPPSTTPPSTTPSTTPGDTTVGSTTAVDTTAVVTTASSTIAPSTDSVAPATGDLSEEEVAEIERALDDLDLLLSEIDRQLSGI